MITSLEEVGAPAVGLSFRYNRQVLDGGENNRVITRRYKIRLTDIATYAETLVAPTLYDTFYPRAVLVAQGIEAIAGNKVDAHLIREFAEVPTEWDDPDDRVITFPGVAFSSLYAKGDFNFRSSQSSLRTDVRVNRCYFLADPKAIPRFDKFVVLNYEGVETTVITDETSPSVDEYIAMVAGGHEIVVDCRVVAWKGAIYCRETTFAAAK